MTTARPVSRSETSTSTGTVRRIAVQIRNEDGHQVLVLPDDVRLSGDSTWLDVDTGTGQLVLDGLDGGEAVVPESDAPGDQFADLPPAKTWDELFARFDVIGPVSPDFMADRPMNKPITARGVFDDDPE